MFFQATAIKILWLVLCANQFTALFYCFRCKYYKWLAVWQTVDKMYIKVYLLYIHSWWLCKWYL